MTFYDLNIKLVHYPVLNDMLTKYGPLMTDSKKHYTAKYALSNITVHMQNQSTLTLTICSFSVPALFGSGWQCIQSLTQEHWEYTPVRCMEPCTHTHGGTFAFTIHLLIHFWEARVNRKPAQKLHNRVHTYSNPSPTLAIYSLGFPNLLQCSGQWIR